MILQDQVQQWLEQELQHHEHMMKMYILIIHLEHDMPSHDGISQT